MKAIATALISMSLLVASPRAQANGNCSSKLFGFSRDGTKLLYNYECAASRGMTVVQTVGTDQSEKYGEQTPVSPRYFDKVPPIQALRLRKPHSKRTGWKGIVERRGAQLYFALAKGSARYELGSKEVEKGFRFTFEGLAWEHEFRAVAFKVKISYASGSRNQELFAFLAPSESVLGSVPDCGALAKLMRCLARALEGGTNRQTVTNQMEDAVAKLEAAVRQARTTEAKREAAKACRLGAATFREQYGNLENLRACF